MCVTNIHFSLLRCIFLTDNFHNALVKDRETIESSGGGGVINRNVMPDMNCQPLLLYEEGELQNVNM